MHTQPGVVVPARARPTGYLWLWVVLTSSLLTYGLVDDRLLPSTGAKVAWAVVWLAATAVLAVPALWARMELTEDGILRRRWLRTARVDTNDLRAIHTRGDHPWAINPSGVITFEDSSGRQVDVELFRGMWHPWGPLHGSLSAVIERSGLPLPGIVASQLHMIIRRPLDVADANRRALQEARDRFRNGATPPHRAKGSRTRSVAGILFTGAFPLLLVWSAHAGMVPADQVRAWQTGFVVLALVGILASILLPARSLELDGRGRLVIRAAGRRTALDLTRLTTVTLDPDAPYLADTDGGRTKPRQPVPKLHLHDADGRTLTIRLGDQWKGQVPILRYVLAAAEERGVALSANARYELEFRLGLVTDPRGTADGVRRS